MSTIRSFQKKEEGIYRANEQSITERKRPAIQPGPWRHKRHFCVSALLHRPIGRVRRTHTHTHSHYRLHAIDSLRHCYVRKYRRRFRMCTAPSWWRFSGLRLPQPTRYHSAEVTPSPRALEARGRRKRGRKTATSIMK